MEIGNTLPGGLRGLPMMPEGEKKWTKKRDNAGSFLKKLPRYRGGLTAPALCKAEDSLEPKNG